MVKKVLACLLLLLMAASGAWAETTLWCGHFSLATLKDGKADYSDARFSYSDFSIGETNLTVTKDNFTLTGTLQLSGGSYSFWDGKEMKKVSGTSRTFKVGIPADTATGDEAAFYPLTDSGNIVHFGVEAENGLNGVTATWNFPDMPSLDNSLTLPNFLTTEEQMENHVVYFEFKYSVTDPTLVTGIDWRIVTSSDTETALTLDYPVNFQRFRAWNSDGTRICDLKPSFYIPAGTPAEGTLDFNSPLKEAEIYRVRTKFYTYDEPVEKCYWWNYYTSTEPEMYLWSRHGSDASLVNGKSDYSNAKFSDIFFDIENKNSVVAESKYFIGTGRVTVIGGGYVLKDLGTWEDLSSIAPGTDMTFSLKGDFEANIGDNYLEYDPIDDSGRELTFSGGAESSLIGKTVTWTFPAEIGIKSGNGRIKNFKTTSEQLASGAPYAEIVSKDGYITAINYRIVTSSDTSTAIKPPYRTDFNFRIHRKASRLGGGDSYNSGTLANTASGTYTLEIPQPFNTMNRLRVRLTTYEDIENPMTYQWYFYPAEAPKNNNQPVNENGDKQDEEKDSQQSDEQDNRQDEEKGNQQSDEQDNQLGGIKVGDGTKGGCEPGLALSGVILLGFFLRKR